MAVLIIILIVAYVAELVSPSSINFQAPLPLPKNGFRSHINYSSDMFFMNLYIGTPKPSLFTAVIATATDLTWTQCQPCKNCLRQTTPIFNPKNSLSYSKIKCPSNKCPPNFKCTNGDCSFNNPYVDTSYSNGVLATETFTFEGNVSVEKLYFGCGFDNHDEFNHGYPGTLGLNRGKLSFVSQMKKSIFSYCLPSYGSFEIGFFSMGSLATIPPGASTTPLNKNPTDPGSYYLSLQGITIGNTKLPIDKRTFQIKKDGSGGMIIDSGCTLTILESSAFDQVTKELTRQLKLQLFNYTMDSDIVPCYNITRLTKKNKFPNIIFQFLNANFVVKPENYIMNIAEKRIGCLMMKSSSSPQEVSVFGNYMQQKAVVVYDLANENLSFLTNTKCSKW